MSWDVFVQDLPTDATCVADIPDDFRPQSIGKRATIIAGIRAEFPLADFSDPAWGILEAGSYSIEFNLGADEQVRSFAMHVRGAVDAVDAVAAVLTRLGLRAFDTSSGGFFSVETAKESMETWSRYRDEALGDEL